ncbi:MAG TPA: enoyl-CoA hydratase-related protein [Dehalococcoidia bacterium]|nr:enoyl-CoA hydratase-related protein [Dehalococcoidia bacterium]
MAYECIKFEVDNHVATLSLNRPEKMNALNRQAYTELEAGVRLSDTDDDIRCLIITGEGRGFCSGDDVAEIMMGDDTPATRRPPVKGGVTPAAKAILACNTPVIAAVNGAAVGWGMDLSLLCDIRIASEKAKFGELFIKRGLIADVGGTYRLARVVGASKANELLFTGDVIDAAEAERIGLVSRVVPAEDLLPTARELAGKIAANAPIAMRFMKEAVRKGQEGDLDRLGEFTSYAYSILFATEDHKEGASAFMERREPSFKGQ